MKVNEMISTLISGAVHHLSTTNINVTPDLLMIECHGDVNGSAAPLAAKAYRLVGTIGQPNSAMCLRAADVTFDVDVVIHMPSYLAP